MHQTFVPKYIVKCINIDYCLKIKLKMFEAQINHTFNTNINKDVKW